MVWVLWKVCGFNHVLHIGQEVHNLHGVVLNRHQRWFSIFQGRLQAVTELGKGFGALVDFLTTDILSWVFALVVVWIARRLDGVFEDQISHLVRLKSDEEKEKGGKDEG